MRLLTLHCFFSTLLTIFYMFSTIDPYLRQLFSHVVFLFSPSFFTLPTTKHILQFTMLDSISLQPARNITEIKKILQSPRQKKRCHVITKPNALIY